MGTAQHNLLTLHLVHHLTSLHLPSQTTKCLKPSNKPSTAHALMHDHRSVLHHLPEKAQLHTTPKSPLYIPLWKKQTACEAAYGTRASRSTQRTLPTRVVMPYPLAFRGTMWSIVVPHAVFRSNSTVDRLWTTRTKSSRPFSRYRSMRMRGKMIVAEESRALSLRP